MSRTCLITIWLQMLLLAAVNAQQTITFPVSDVKKATEPLEDTTYRIALENALNLKDFNENRLHNKLQKETKKDYWEIDMDSLLHLPSVQAQFAELEAAGVKSFELIPTHGSHPVVSAMYQAYAGHRPLTLSPDMIWLMIAQGFAKHVDINAEQLRSKLVDFEGKKVLTVRRDDFLPGSPDNPWMEVFPAFGKQIETYTGKPLVERMVPAFSTTTAFEKAAFEVTLMDAMSSYFVYAFHILCGIPEITLEGTPEDWAQLETQAAQLAPYDLDWWTTALQPILHEFTAASKGNANPAFWQQMFRNNQIPDGCTSINHIDGWVLQFFPYLDGKKNPWITEPAAAEKYRELVASAATFNASAEAKELQTELEELEKKKKFPAEKWRNIQKKLDKGAVPDPGVLKLPVVEIADLPNGLAKADILANYNGIISKIEFHAGFIGIQQDKQTLALRPEISWMVVDPKEMPDAKDLEIYEKAQGLFDQQASVKKQ